MTSTRIKPLLGVIFWATSSHAMDVDPEIELAFFNVGQGNCRVVKSPDRKDVWIIDAGSKKNPNNFTDNDSFTHKQVTTALKKWIGTTKLMSFHIILSHHDEDHYNIIPALRNNYPTHNFTFYISDKYKPDEYGATTFKDFSPDNIKLIKFTKYLIIFYKT